MERNHLTFSQNSVEHACGLVKRLRLHINKTRLIHNTRVFSHASTTLYFVEALGIVLHQLDINPIHHLAYFQRLVVLALAFATDRSVIEVAKVVFQSIFGELAQLFRQEFVSTIYFWLLLTFSRCFLWTSS